MKHFIWLSLLGALLLSACGLRRSNPLDPIGNPNLDVPEVVSNVQCSPSPPGAANKYVTVTWEPNSNRTTDGYYVYRGLAYNSAYAVVDTVETNIGTCTHGSDPWHNVYPGQYWSKVSAFKDCYRSTGEFLGRLEGRLSQPRWVEVR